MEEGINKIKELIDKTHVDFERSRSVRFIMDFCFYHSEDVSETHIGLLNFMYDKGLINTSLINESMNNLSLHKIDGE